MLPDIDGIEVCRRIRADVDLPILMLTARDDDLDKIVGLEVGADDYLTKPFNPRELVARVRAILRRARRPKGAPDGGGARARRPRRIDAGRRECHVGEQEIQLAPKEFDLLWELLDHRGLVLTRDQLLERVWGYTFAGDTRTVDVHVRQLRRKLGDASPIVTVWGIGYKARPARGPPACRSRLLRCSGRFASGSPALFLLGIVLAGRRRVADRDQFLPELHPCACERRAAGGVGGNRAAVRAAGGRRDTSPSRA